MRKGQVLGLQVVKENRARVAIYWEGAEQAEVVPVSAS